MTKWPVIKQATQAFCGNAARNRDFDLAILKLDSFPTDPITLKNSEFTDDQWKTFEENFKKPGGNGEGTDQVTAMDKVVAAAAGDGSTVPESVVLLYFSDMLVDQPTDKHTTFRQWKQFDWQRLNKAGIHKAVFYVVRIANPKQSNATRAAYRQQEMVLAEIKDAARSAKVDAQWVNDSDVEDQLAKGRFTGPEFN
jgi:hypothetical protein